MQKQMDCWTYGNPHNGGLHELLYESKWASVALQSEY